MRKKFRFCAVGLLLILILTGCSGLLLSEPDRDDPVEDEQLMGIPYEEIVISGSGEVGGGECILIYEGEIQDKEITEKLCSILNEICSSERVDGEKYPVMGSEWFHIASADHSHEIEVRRGQMEEGDGWVNVIRFSAGSDSDTYLMSFETRDAIIELLEKGVCIKENYREMIVFPLETED